MPGVMPQASPDTVPGGGHEWPFRSSVGNPSVSRITYCFGLQPLFPGGLPLKTLIACCSNPGSADCPPAALISPVPGLLVSGARKGVNCAMAAFTDAGVGRAPAVVILTRVLPCVADCPP